MNYGHRIIIPALVVAVVVSTALLVGGRLGLPWAGGNGFVRHDQVRVDGETFRRGEVISTEQEFLTFDFDDAKIWMDRNTEVKLVDGRAGSLTIKVVQGRVVLQGSLTVVTREIKTHLDGTTSFVHYSWLDKIDLAAIEGGIEVELPDEVITVGEKAKSIQTLPPYEMADIKFDPAESSSAAFYEFALKND